ncbi:type IV secretion system protein VirB9 [Granulicella aggregans]|uniref:Type IV secretion system protein VirB9 n=1 Tax=Granulicella aggregans TaxID=474949 RepID=A0A7W7ZKB3_9BACT|nr:TrbG/VirB9 family P-type conjugative transfer protein [Granulicella aggregans]MBB5061509.1 type IV secretion system protein VirB9 [Granulicella aggregans]
MTLSLCIFVTAAAIGTAGNAQTTHLQPSAPRTIVTADASAPPVVRTGLLQSTLIELPSEEKVATVFGGDTVSWVFDAGHVASRYISIKPKVADSTTDLHIVSDHGNEYTVELREVSSDKDNPHFDSKVYVTSSDPKVTDNIATPPVFVPAAEAEAKEAQLKKEAEDARKTAEADHKAAATAAESFKAAYPGTLHFDYAWDQKKGKALGIQQIWRDDKFTYLRGRFQETPALYELKDGKGSLINYDFANGLYTIPKAVIQGYLSIGKRRVDFRQTKAGS